MDTLLHRFRAIIKGTIEGFDRLVFKGILRPIAYATGMQMFLLAKGVLNKDYKNWVNVKGLNENDMKRIIDDGWKTFSINENYRNARQITEYINSVFNISMMPIGINGFVECHNIGDFTIKIDPESADRVVVIVKDIDLFVKIRTNKLITEEDNNKINIIMDDGGLIKKGVLNIIPINLAKGLEFEQVYVVPENMSENDIYVAYTRALKQLYILNK